MSNTPGMFLGIRFSGFSRYRLTSARNSVYACITEKSIGPKKDSMCTLSTDKNGGCVSRFECSRLQVPKGKQKKEDANFEEP